MRSLGLYSRFSYYVPLLLTSIQDLAIQSSRYWILHKTQLSQVCLRCERFSGNDFRHCLAFRFNDVLRAAVPPHPAPFHSLMLSSQYVTEAV